MGGYERLRTANEPIQEDLARRYEALQSLQRQQSEQMLSVVHDLRNPLSALCGELDWMNSQPLTPTEQAEALDLARGAATRMNAMIATLLAVFRIEQSQGPPQRRAVSLPALVSRLAVSYGRRFGLQGIPLPPPLATQLVVQADPALLRRVLENLIDNALRYTPRGGRIAIHTRVQSGTQIIVSNNGPAIPPRDRARIFHKFARGSAEPSIGGNSFGLGLYFCRQTIEAHGGTIDVEDTDDWPTSFVITLP
jgi:signal transduction histidine kinase